MCLCKPSPMPVCISLLFEAQCCHCHGKLPAAASIAGFRTAYAIVSSTFKAHQTSKPSSEGSHTCLPTCYLPTCCCRNEVHILCMCQLMVGALIYTGDIASASKVGRWAAGQPQVVSALVDKLKRRPEQVRVMGSSSGGSSSNGSGLGARCVGRGAGCMPHLLQDVVARRPLLVCSWLVANCYCFPDSSLPLLLPHATSTGLPVVQILLPSIMNALRLVAQLCSVSPPLLEAFKSQGLRLAMEDLLQAMRE